MQKKNKHTEEKEQIIILNEIIKNLETTKNNKETFENKIKLYGTINYSRKQLFPRISSHITKNKEYEDTFLNYITAESMILDIFMVIESDIIQQLETTNTKIEEKIIKLINFSLEILIILEKILENKYEYLEENKTKTEYEKDNTEYTNELYHIQNKFYTLIYDEKIDFRVQ